MRLSGPTRTPPAIAAVQLWLPPHRDSAATALAAGRLDTETADRLGYLALAESRDRSAPEMAVLAATKGLAEAGWSGDELDLVAHAYTYYQGHDFWAPASYVAHQIGAAEALAIGVQQMCNGGAAALEIAVSRMIADPAVNRCAVTTADRFAAPAFDRWRGDYDVAYGDGATALLLDRSVGPYRLLSIASLGRADFEQMHRGTARFADAAGRTVPIDVRAAKRSFISSGAEEVFAVALRESVVRVVHQALAEAGLAAGDDRVRFLALPRLGTGTLDTFFAPALDDLRLRQLEVLDFGRSSGHLGAGDSAANLAELHAGNRLGSGEVALLLSLGGGFTWSCIAVVAE
jgi:3-oxoacyl-[acyl-carrier-protein] synthase-3